MNEDARGGSLDSVKDATPVPTPESRSVALNPART